MQSRTVTVVAAAGQGHLVAGSGEVSNRTPICCKSPLGVSVVAMWETCEADALQYSDILMVGWPY